MEATTRPDTALRPTTWTEYVGQEELKETLALHAEASVILDERMGHVLLVGPPGVGKTSLAALVADAAQRDFESFIMPLEPKVLVALVREFFGVVLFDELHRSPVKQQEILLPLLEDQYLQLPNGRRVYNDQITVIGATTEEEDLIKPLIDRFAIRPRWREYTDDEMAQIVFRMAARLGVTMNDETCMAIGKASGGVPRNSRSLVSTARALEVRSGEPATVKGILRAAKVTPDGLTEDHVAYLNVLRKIGGTAGVDLLATHLRKDPSTVKDLERLLLRKELIEYTGRGRILIEPRRFGRRN